MAVKRRRFKKKFTRRKKMPIVRLIKKVIQNQAEHKYTNFLHQSIGIVDVAPFAVTLLDILEGTSINERVGLSIQVARIHLRYKVITANTNIRINVRVYVIQNHTDKDPAALPAIEAIFPTLQEAKVRYSVLYDRTHQMALGINQVIYKDIKLKAFKLKEIRYDGPGASFDIGNIKIHFLTDAVSAEDVFVSSIGRTLFTDL